MDRFTGKSVLVTGGGSGIGRATVLRLLAEGASVLAVDADGEGLARTQAAVTGPGRLRTQIADVTDEAAVAGAVDLAAEAHGGIDALVNIAGIHATTPIGTLAADDLRRLFEVNVVGTAVFCREALRHLPRGGVIVNTGSTAGSHGNPYMSAYSASKGAVIALSLSLAAELVSRGIRVLTVSPGTVATPMTAGLSPGELDFGYYQRIISPLGPARPEQIAATIAFAASADASYLTGIDLRVDGGSHT